MLVDILHKKGVNLMSTISSIIIMVASISVVISLLLNFNDGENASMALWSMWTVILSVATLFLTVKRVVYAVTVIGVLQNILTFWIISGTSIEYWSGLFALVIPMNIIYGDIIVKLYEDSVDKMHKDIQRHIDNNLTPN